MPTGLGDKRFHLGADAMSCGGGTFDGVAAVEVQITEMTPGICELKYDSDGSQ